MKSKRKALTQRKESTIDLDQVAAELEVVVGEPVSGVMTQHGVTLLLTWHESWLALSASNVDGLEAIQLNAELIQVGRIMQAFSIFSSDAASRFNYAVFSLTQHHMHHQSSDGQDFIKKIDVRSGEASGRPLCHKDYYATTQN